MSHPLGPLADLIMHANTWQTQQRTYAGIWHPLHADAIGAALATHTRSLTPATIRQLQRLGQLPGVRQTRHLVALLPVQSEDDRVDEDAPTGVPIWQHGTFSQARITPVAQAIHLARYLDDFHEPTLAAQRRAALRGLDDADDAVARTVALDAVATRFLAAPVRWRDAVATVLYHRAMRAIEQALGSRLSAPGRTIDELRAKVAAGLTLLADLLPDMAIEIHGDLAARAAQLDQATVVLMYEERQYLQLFGVQHGKAVRRYLPGGLHLVLSDQQHRRADRFVNSWLAASQPDQFIPPAYYVAPTMPAVYAAQQRRATLRLRDAAAVVAYLQRPAPDTSG